MIIFYCIAADIHQCLLEMYRTSYQLCMDDFSIFYIIIDTSFICLHPGDFIRIMQKFQQIKVLSLKLYIAGFQLIHIQHIINKI